MINFLRIMTMSVAEMPPDTSDIAIPVSIGLVIVCVAVFVFIKRRGK